MPEPFNIHRGLMSTLGTHQRPLARCFNSNSTYNTALASAGFSLTRPSTGGVVLSNIGPANWFWLLPFGTDAANETFNIWISPLRWGLDTFMAIPTVKLAVTLGSATGVTGSDLVADTDLIADTIVASDDINPTPVRVVSPADNTMAMMGLNIFGAPAVFVQMSRSGKTAASMNALWWIT